MTNTHAHSSRGPIKLPFPVTTNNLYRNRRGRGGRAKTKRYQAWSTEAGWEIKRQRPGFVEGPFKLDITITRPDKRRRDISNLIKALEDALVEFGVVEDDCLCEQITIGWRDKRDGPVIEVTA